MPAPIEVRKVPLHNVSDASELAKLIDDGVMEADTLVIATDVANVMVDFGTPSARPLGRVTVAELREHAAAGQFARGSMGPKVDAVLRFVEAGGTRAVVTSLEHIADAVQGDAGTVLTR